MDTRDAPEVPAIADGASRTTALRILIVEDNLDFAELLEQLLTDWGHTTAIATDGLSALERASSFQPDVAFIDIGLPGMNGYDLARALRADPAPRAQLVAVSGYGEREHRQQAEAAGFDRYLVKPILDDALAALLASLQARPRAQDRARE